MTYKENLLFISKCLEISVRTDKISEVENILSKNDINWEEVVKITSLNQILPAFFTVLTKYSLIKYLPLDLQSYMTKITAINRNRNIKVLEQINEINEIFVSNEINVIFIKGSSNLICNLYDDIAERMVGDIDIIVSEKSYFKAIKLMKENGYVFYEDIKNPLPNFRHYRRLIKKNRIAALEIHKNLTTSEFSQNFNFKHISKNTIDYHDFKLLSHENQIIMTILSDAINDYGFYYKNISLKSAYDLLLLGKKFNNKKFDLKLGKLHKPIFSYLVMFNFLFPGLNSIQINDNKFLSNYKSKYIEYLSDKKRRLNHIKFQKIRINIKNYYKLFIRIIFQKVYRKWFFNKLLKHP